MRIRCRWMKTNQDDSSGLGETLIEHPIGIPIEIRCLLTVAGVTRVVLSFEAALEKARFISARMSLRFSSTAAS